MVARDVHEIFGSEIFWAQTLGVINIRTEFPDKNKRSEDESDYITLLEKFLKLESLDPRIIKYFAVITDLSKNGLT
jgi:hypothetical protein